MKIDGKWYLMETEIMKIAAAGCIFAKPTEMPAGIC